MSYDRQNRVSDALGRTFYDPKAKVARWNMDVAFLSMNLTEEQVALAAKIINENNKGYGFSVFTNILNALAHAGFGGKIQSYYDITLPMVVVINSKKKQ